MVKLRMSISVQIAHCHEKQAESAVPEVQRGACKSLQCACASIFLLQKKTDSESGKSERCRAAPCIHVVRRYCLLLVVAANYLHFSVRKFICSYSSKSRALTLELVLRNG